MREKVWNFLIGSFWAVLLIGGYIYASATSSSNISAEPELEPRCEYYPISYETVEHESEDYEIDYREVIQKGQDGEREICYDENGSEVSNEILTFPTNEEVTIGTFEPSVYEYSSSVRTGAICMDGTYSSATGRGACSWHGGVSEWLY